MGYGEKLDTFAGTMSRFLHLRGAKHNTVKDIGQYYDLPLDSFFPAPRPITELKTERRLFDKMLKTSTLSWTSGHEPLCENYARRHHAEYRKNKTAWARWIRPEGQIRDTCIIYVHGWLEPGSWVEEATLFKKWTKELGVDILHISLPFHGRRNPRGALFSGEYFWTADLVRSVEGVRQAIYDTRAIMAWLGEQGYERIGVSGISLGGALTMMLACVDPTPDFIVPIVGHLKLEDAVEEAPILWRMKHDLEKWGIDEAQRRDIFASLGISRYRPKLAPGKQLWIEAEEDGYINPKLVKEQWADWSEPQIHWISGGHMTFPIHASEMTKRISAFLAGL